MTAAVIHHPATAPDEDGQFPLPGSRAWPPQTPYTEPFQAEAEYWAAVGMEASVSEARALLFGCLTIAIEENDFGRATNEFELTASKFTVIYRTRESTPREAAVIPFPGLRSDFP